MDFIITSRYNQNSNKYSLFINIFYTTENP